MKSGWLRASVILFALWGVIAPAGGFAEPAPQVTDIRHGMHGARVRILVDISDPPAFAAFTLRNPDRLVIDFPALDWAVPEDAILDIPYVAAVRYGLFRPDRARMVMDLAEPVVIERIFTQPAKVSEPGRLVIDLAPSSREAFDARAGAPEHARWLGRAPEPPRVQSDEIVIAIDPGHGGVDPGASYGNLKEKNATLTFSRALADAITARPGMVSYLIRDEDAFVPLAERVARAHRAGAHVLISVHADTVEEGVADGMSIYRLSTKGSDRAAIKLAERENRADLVAGTDLGGESDALTQVIIELAQRGTQDESSKLAQSVLEALRSEVKLLRSRPLRQGNFRVLKAPDIPSILLEIGFLNSPQDRKRLSDPAWRAKASSRIAAGLAAWMKVASPGFLTPR